MTGSDIAIRLAMFDEIVALRHKVLRAGLPRDAAIFPGDHEPSTMHYGVFDAFGVLACATLHASAWEGSPAWQLRGMATRADGQRKGFGRALLQFLETDVLESGKPPVLWCNARVPAAGFYQTLGWQIVSGIFEVPTAGPHYRMLRRLT